MALEGSTLEIKEVTAATEPAATSSSSSSSSQPSNAKLLDRPGRTDCDFTPVAMAALFAQGRMQIQRCVFRAPASLRVAGVHAGMSGSVVLLKSHFEGANLLISTDSSLVANRLRLVMGSKAEGDTPPSSSPKFHFNGCGCGLPAMDNSATVALDIDTGSTGKLSGCRISGYDVGVQARLGHSFFGVATGALSKGVAGKWRGGGRSKARC